MTMEVSNLNSIFNLIDEMESYFDTCNKIFMSNKIGVDIEVVYEFITDLRIKLPDEIKKAERIVEERDSILAEAKKAASDTNAQAENQVAKMVNEHEIMQKAYKEAELVLAEAKNTAREMKLGAYEYVDELIIQFKAAAEDTLKQTDANYSRYREYLQQQLNVLDQNRLELQEKKSGRKR